MANATGRLNKEYAFAVNSVTPNATYNPDSPLFAGTALLCCYAYNENTRCLLRPFIAANPTATAWMNGEEIEDITCELTGHDMKSRPTAGVTWNTKPAINSQIKATITGEPFSDQTAAFNVTDIEVARNLVKNGIQIDGEDLAGLVDWKNTISPSPYYMDITYDDVGVPLNVTLANDIEFFKEDSTYVSWVAEPSRDDTLMPVKPVRAVFQWKASASGSVHDIVAGGTSYVFIPAGTFTTETVMARLQVTSNDNVTTTTDWVTYSVLPPYLTDEAPVSGYVDEKVSNIFSWNIRQQGSESEVPQASGRFLYRAGDASQMERQINVTTQKQVTIPANTLNGDPLIWKVEVTTVNGTTLSSSVWHQLTTVESPSTAVALSPRNEAVSGNEEIAFTWAHVIETGSAQTAFDLQISQNQSTWTTIRTATQTETTATILADTLPGGVVYWRVRTYNSDNVAGEWSDPAQIIVIAAPATPGLSVTAAAPKWTVQWTQDGQQGYEIEYDGETIFSGYGTETAFTFPGYADDGSHTVRVRIQNQYSLWSGWASAALAIQNVPPRTLTLRASASDTLPEVTLTASGAASEYWFIRDGKVIAKTTQAVFVDRFANGRAEYSVIGVNNDRNYSPANTVTVDLQLLIPWIWSFRSSVWIPLRMSEAEVNAAAQNLSSATNFLHFSGSAKPSVEFGESIDRSISFAVGFLNDSQDKDNFLAATGGLACLKLPDGDVIFGALSGWSRKHGRIYTEYSSKITETAFDEVAANG